MLVRPKMGMSRHVWVDMWHHDIHFRLLLSKYYHLAKYWLVYPRGSWDIKIWKMVQSDWLRAFSKISLEPDFSKTCSFRQKMPNILLNKFREFQKILMTSFQEKYEKHHFLPNFGTFSTFSQEPDFFFENWAPSLFHPY